VRNSKSIPKTKVTIVTRKPFDISKRQLELFDTDELENMLAAFNYAEGNNFYILDYYRKKIFVGSPSALILGGFEKQVLDDEGFCFFERVLPDREWKWLNRVNHKMYQFFFSCPEPDRKHLAFSCDFKISTVKGKQIILRHTIVPYKLCKNGNLWLGLCHVSLSPHHESGHPTILNRKTGERYDLIHTKFVKTQHQILTDEELMILEWMVKGLSDKLICERLNFMPMTNFKRRKRILYDKLNAGTAAEAIHNAHLGGMI
jgi:DNA-binding CsgD family transcriptional regulator